MAMPFSRCRQVTPLYDAYATSSKISVSRSGMSTMASWPHGIS
jgi:hypothetical protein